MAEVNEKLNNLQMINGNQMNAIQMMNDRIAANVDYENHFDEEMLNIDNATRNELDLLT